MLFEAGDLSQAAFVALRAGEFGGHVLADEVDGQFGTDHAGAEAHDVDVVILDGLMGGEGVVAGGGAHSFELVGGDAGSGAAAAEQDGAVGAFVEDGLGYGARVVGIIDGVGRIGAEVDGFVSQFAQFFDDSRFERESGVIACYSHLHGIPS
jgi:hypothetical protein